jgi:hypothetical protein
LESANGEQQETAAQDRNRYPPPPPHEENGHTQVGQSESEPYGRSLIPEMQLVTVNQAFRQIAIAGVRIQTYRATSDDISISPGGFALVVPNADSAQMHPDGRAYVFFTSSRKEREIQQMEQQAEKLCEAANRHSDKGRRPAP